MTLSPGSGTPAASEAFATSTFEKTAVSNAVLSGLYQFARAVAYVPLLEGFGLPVIEAMRAGTHS